MELTRIQRVFWVSRASVFLVFCLISVGGLVTSWQAGMAVPDWPLSFGSLNPEGWWANVPVRLEHGHRLLAAFVGAWVGLLCAMVWGNWRALGVAVLVSGVCGGLGGALKIPAPVMAHLGIWPAAVGFVTVLWLQQGSGRAEFPLRERRLALAAFVLVCIQAALGGFRVTQETAGAVAVATLLRVVHGCVAQAFMVVLVGLCVRLSLLRQGGAWGGVSEKVSGRLIRVVAVAVVLVYAQLVVGATMRHLGAGLAIPTFPEVDAAGHWVPRVAEWFTSLNFAHTRVGALVVLGSVAVAGVFVLRERSLGAPVRGWMRAACVAVVLQAVLGALVVIHLKPRTLATLHVVLGAGLLAALAAVLVHLLSVAPRSSERIP